MKSQNIIIATLLSGIIAWQAAFAQDCPTRKNFQKRTNWVSELSIGFGGTHYFGDLNTYNTTDRKIGELHKENMKPSININYRLYPSRFLNARVSFFYTRLAGSDRYNNTDDTGFSASWFRKYRNLTFRTDLFELSLLAEINVLGFKPGQSKRFSPYILAGAGLIYFDPKAPYNEEWISRQNAESVSPIANSSEYEYDEWVSLQPLGTEGQGLPGYPDKYSRIQPNYTLGVGLKCSLSPSVTIAWEVSHHFTFTDYLDDVSTSYPNPADYYAHYNADHAQMAANLSVRSKEVDPTGEHSFITSTGQQRGSPKNKDSYLVSLLTVGYKLSNADRHSVGNPKKIQRQEDKKNEKEEKMKEKEQIEYYKDKYYNKRSGAKLNLSKI